MRTRIFVLTPLVAVTLATAAAAAPAPAPQVKDPAGDAIGMQASTDIVSVLYATEGKSGKPTKLSITMTLAGPVRTDPGLTYEAEATTDTCGDVTVTAEPGTPYESVTGMNGWVDWGDCSVGDSSVALLAAKIKDKTITWTFGIKGSPLKLGTVFQDFRARVDPTNPVVPFPSSATNSELGQFDGATGKGSWKLR